MIRAAHLRSALAVWDYCDASARFIFGEALGDPVADELLRALRVEPEGLTRTDISELFGRNRGSREIDRALASLAEHGLARPVVEESHRGRPAERWVYARAATKETK